MTIGNIIDKIEPIYSGTKEDFTWVGFGSGRGTNLEACVKIKSPSAIVTDKPSAKLLELEKLANSAHLVFNGFKECGSWKKAQGNLQLEAEYEERSYEFNQLILTALKQHEEEIGKPIDLIVLGGYMRLVKEPILRAYEDRIINVHPAHLPPNVLSLNSVASNIPRWLTGDNAVYDALTQDYKKTKSSVIIVNEGIDHGEILTQGPYVCVEDTFNQYMSSKKYDFKEFADFHQGIQKEKSDWPALTTALELIANGRLALGREKNHFNEWRTVYLDEKPLPYEGLQLGGK